MGINVDILMVDWTYLESLPTPDARMNAIWKAAEYANDQLHEYRANYPKPDWDFAMYTSPFVLESYKAWFWASEAYDDIRPHLSATLRDSFDPFFRATFWGGEEQDYEATHDLGQDIAWGNFGDGLIFSMSPATVARLATHWQIHDLNAKLTELREPFVAYCNNRSDGWIGTFEAFDDFVRAWADLLQQAYQHGWGVLGAKT